MFVLDVDAETPTYIMRRVLVLCSFLKGYLKRGQDYNEYPKTTNKLTTLPCTRH